MADPVIGGVGAPRDETGPDEAVEAAARADYEHIVGIPGRKSAQPWDKLTEDHRRSYRYAAARMLAAAAPVIAAAVRADVLREVEAALDDLAMSSMGPNDVTAANWNVAVDTVRATVRALASGSAT